MEARKSKTEFPTTLQTVEWRVSFVSFGIRNVLIAPKQRLVAQTRGAASHEQPLSRCHSGTRHNKHTAVALMLVAVGVFV
jgi:hypothetical protein